MDGNSNSFYRDHDDELNAELDRMDEPLEGLSIQNQRMAKIQHYEESALAREEPLDAMIGMGNAYLQRIFECVGSAVLEEIESGSKSIDEVRELTPEIRLLLQLRKSIEIDVGLQAIRAAQSPSSPRSRNGKGIKLAAPPPSGRHLSRH